MQLQTDLLQLTLQTVTATQKPDASQQELEALGRLFDELKKAEVHNVAALAAKLANESNPLEVQLFALQLMQHLVGLRWQEFTAQDHQQLASLSFSFLTNTGSSETNWAVRSKSALLMALLTKRMGAPFWGKLLPELISFASQGPVQAEKVCMVLRLVTEEVTWTNDSNAGPEVQEWRRAMLSALVGTLDTVLPFLHHVLESCFGQAVRAAESGDLQAAKALSSAVSSSLAALGEYSEWAPLGRLSSSGVISACKFLLNTQDFRSAACDVLRRIACRRQAQEEPQIFRAAMAETGEALIAAAEIVLAPQNAGELGHGGTWEEFAQFVCQSMGMWGYSHISTLPTERKTHYLQMSLRFTQNDYVLLAHKALPLWVSLLGSAERAQRGSKEEAQLPLDCVAALMDLAGEKMRTGVHMVEETAEVPEEFESFEEYRAFLLEYRELLSRIVRLTASILPEQALQAATRRLHQAVQVCSTSGHSIEDKSIQFEAACYFIDSVVSTVSQTFLPGGKRRPDLVVNVDPGTVNGILECQESMFRVLLEIHFAEPVLVGYLAKLLEAFTRLVALRKNLAVLIISKVFDMFDDLPMEGGPCHLPPNPPPGWKERFHARSKIPGILVTYAKFASEAMRPHVEALAAKTDECWRSKMISPGERALFCDMMIASVCSADLTFQQEVVEHVLRSTQEEWRSAAWQSHLATPEAMVAYFCPINRTSPDSFEIGGGFNRWIAAHHLQLLERAIKRLPASADSGAANPQTISSPSWHVLNPHLDWMLPSLLQMMINLHALSTPQGLALLREGAAGLQMGARERAVYLRQLTKGRQEGDADIKEEEGATMAGNNVAALRSWFRQTRETLYQTVGCLIRNVGGFYSCSPLQPLFVQALTQNLGTLHTSHIRTLIRHIMIQLVKNCPLNKRKEWLLPVMTPLMLHLYQRLVTNWENVLQNTGKLGVVAAQMGANTREDSSTANEEVIQERLLRELTTETLVLMRCTQGSPEADGTVHESVLQLTWREAPPAAMAACMTAVSALWWPDDVAGRASAFLRGVVPVAGRQALEESAGREIVRGCIEAISNGITSQQSEVMGLARDVLIIQPSLPGTREVLLQLPDVTQAMVESFDKALLATHSEKEQRSLIKSLLVASGSEQLKMALLDWRPVSSLANMSEPKPRMPKLAPADEAGGTIGLAASN